MTKQATPDSEAVKPARPLAAHGASARASLGVFATRVALLPLSIVVSILVTRILGPADRGRYAFLMLLGGFILPCMSLGFGASVIYFISSGLRTPGNICASCLLMGLALGVGNAGVIWMLWHWNQLGDTAAGLPPALMLLTLAVLPLQGANLLLSRILLGASWFTLNNVVALLTPVISAILLTMLVVVLKMGLTGAAVAAAATQLLTLLFLLIAIARRDRMTARLDVKFIGLGLSYGVRAWAGDLAARLNLRLDQFVLGVRSTASTLGVYAVAVQVTEMLWMVPDALTIVLYNRIASATSEQSRVALVGRVHRVLMVVMIALALLCALASDWLVRALYGAAFSEAVKPLYWLLPGTVGLTTAKVITKYFGGKGMPGRSSVINIVGAGASAVLYYALIPIWGATGAAIASSLGYLVTCVASVALYLRTIKPRTAGLWLPRRGDLHWLIDQFRGAVTPGRSAVA